ncbi:MAG: hypothetical protein HW412_1151 [Bacteroidetes bacterium]|nr:hypothetical protein [Bacteroidota bacterium]
MFRGRAGNGTRTRDINLGKVALYQLSYSRMGRSNITNDQNLCKPLLLASIATHAIRVKIYSEQL